MATPPTFTAGSILTASQMNNVGLWRVGSATATSGTTLDIANCFSSDFDAYRVVLSNVRFAAAGSFSFQLMNGTTPSASNYAWAVQQVAYDASGGPSGSGYPSYVTNWRTISDFSTSAGAFSCDIFNPFLAQYSYYSFNGTDSRAINGYGLRVGGGIHADATSYSSLRFTTTASTITNVVATVYGYRK
jgi:hypothetical protein